MKIAYYLPENKITNDYLASIANDPEFSSEKIYQKTGIKIRHKANNGELVSHMCAKAAKKLFSEYSIESSEIDFVLLCSQTPDYLQPATAFLVANELGLRTNIGAFDVNIACSGYTYALCVAKGLISAKMAKKVLVLTSDALASTNESSPMAQRVLFSDSATATLIDESNINKIYAPIFGSDGSGFFTMYRKFGGRAFPIDKNSFDEYISSPSPFTPELKGPEVFLFTLREVPKLVENILSANNASIDDMDYFIFHQANLLILNSVAKILKLPKEKMLIDIEEVGNTSSSSIPIAIKRGFEKGSLKKGKKALIAGFGTGLSWSGTIIEL